MDNLIAGLLGALIATILSIVYLHTSEIFRRRYDLAIDAAIYSDEIYNDIQVIDAFKPKIYSGEDVPNELFEPYIASTNRLRVSVTSSIIHMRARIVYGDTSDELKTLEGLRSYYTTCSLLLWRSTKENWTDTSKEIHDLFDNQIDPLRGMLEQRLTNSTKTTYIIKNLLNIKKYLQCLNKK